MSSPTASLVRVDASKVKEIAEKVRKHAEQERQRVRNDFITAVIHERRTQRFFPEETSYREAAKIVDEKLDGWGFRAYPWENECREEFDLSSRLLAAVDLALDNELWLNLKDAETVQKWIVEEKEKNL